ncbi:MAG: PASTA domain-containing protein, partial [Actinobacteria bacterium]|nr:PASTA domain-containing protein [Actinomycetota bacterium]
MQKRGVRVTMEPTELMVDPGGEVTTTVTVRNLGTRVEEFGLTPQGTAAAFASVTPVTVSIYPDLEQRAVVRFAPLRAPQNSAGVTTFEIVARSVVHSDVCDVARGQLTVTPFDDLKAVLTPDLSRGRKPARHQVSVTNGGNTPVSTQLAFHDQDGALTFEPKEGTATLQPGVTEDLPVLVNGPRRWFGRAERYPFSAVVTPPEPHPLITLNGTRQQTAVFPRWVPAAAVVLIVLAIALAALLALRTPTVPRIGLVDETTAVKQLEDADYVPVVVKRGDDNVAPGLAIKTDPAGGTPLEHGEQVNLFISTGKCPDGPCPVEVPNVEGLALSEAQAKLEDQKFTVRIIKEPSDDRPADRVIASDPKATTMRPLGSEVVLTVSSGPKEQNNGSPPVSPPVGGGPQPSAPPSAPPPAPIAIPDLTARSVDDATKALTDL